MQKHYRYVALRWRKKIAKHTHNQILTGDGVINSRGFFFNKQRKFQNNDNKGTTNRNNGDIREPTWTFEVIFIFHPDKCRVERKSALVLFSLYCKLPSSYQLMLAAQALFQLQTTKPRTVHSYRYTVSLRKSVSLH